MGYLSNEIEKTGIIFGFLRQIKKFALLYNTKHFVFAWDSKKSKRKEIFPNYRERHKNDITEEELKWHNDAFKQFMIIRKKVLPECGFYNSFIQSGYEADDVIASLVNSIKYDKIIVTSDEDLFQLLSKNTKIFNLKNKIEITEDCFVSKFGIHPNKWASVKAIAGCQSDKVPGCIGIGEKTAIKFLKGELQNNSKKYQKIEKYLASDEYLCYNKIVTLPFEGTRKFDCDFEATFNKVGFLNICKRFGFNSLLEPRSVNDWFEIFC
jgi:DNA polymerase-1